MELIGFAFLVVAAFLAAGIPAALGVTGAGLILAAQAVPGRRERAAP